MSVETEKYFVINRIRLWKTNLIIKLKKTIYANLIFICCFGFL